MEIGGNMKSVEGCEGIIQIYYSISDVCGRYSAIKDMEIGGNMKSHRRVLSKFVTKCTCLVIYIVGCNMNSIVVLHS